MRFSVLFATTAAALTLGLPAAAVDIVFYTGSGCRGSAVVGRSTVHDVNHRYNCPAGTDSLDIFDNGLNRNVVITGGASGSHRGNGCLTPSGRCTTYELRT